MQKIVFSLMPIILLGGLVVVGQENGKRFTAANGPISARTTSVTQNKRVTRKQRFRKRIENQVHRFEDLFKKKTKPAAEPKALTQTVPSKTRPASATNSKREFVSPASHMKPGPGQSRVVVERPRTYDPRPSKELWQLDGANPTTAAKDAARPTQSLPNRSGVVRTVPASVEPKQVPASPTPAISNERASWGSASTSIAPSTPTQAKPSVLRSSTAPRRIVNQPDEPKKQTSYRRGLRPASRTRSTFSPTSIPPTARQAQPVLESLKNDWTSQATQEFAPAQESNSPVPAVRTNSVPVFPASTQQTFRDSARFPTATSMPQPQSTEMRSAPRVLETLPQLEVPEPSPAPAPRPIPTPVRRFEQPPQQVPVPSFPSLNSVPVQTISARRMDATSRFPNRTSQDAIEVPQEPHPRSASTTHMSRRQRQATIASRGALAGFKGFCPVELQDHRVLRDSHPNLFANHGTRTYYFSTAQARQRFLKNPTRYVPAAEGIDVVDLVDQNAKTPGRLDYAQWFQNRLYLFASAHSMDTFNANPQRYANP
ncbi:MAG: hypothetical protein AB8G99_06580 [Planctomycetaceae bacterium]